YPEVSAEDRLARADPVDASLIRVSPQQAWSGDDPPTRVSLEMLVDRPIYRFGARSIVYADTGKPLRDVSAELALGIAAQWTGQPGSAARFEGAVDTEDQWTVGGVFRRFRPLLKYSWPSREEVYVSTVTAQVEQYTTRASRIAAYFGAIPHWLYF